MILTSVKGVEYYLNEKLGNGSDGNVYVGKKRNSDTTVAIKITRQLYQIGENCRELTHNLLLAQHEVEGVCKMLDHGFVKALEGGIRVFMIFEYMPSDLFDYARNQELSELEVKAIILRIIKILIGMQKCGVVPMDMKDENILIDPKTLEIKLCDFASLASTYEMFTAVSSHGGTDLFLSPESIEHDRFYPTRTITWHVGLLAYSILNGVSLPWKVKYDGREASTFPYTEDVSEEAKDFVSFCLVQNVYARPDLIKLFSHPWFSC